jgi:hypothetical protein
MFVIQNNLQYLAASNLSVPLFQITYQLKVGSVYQFHVHSLSIMYTNSSMDANTKLEIISRSLRPHCVQWFFWNAGWRRHNGCPWFSWRREWPSSN